MSLAPGHHQTVVFGDDVILPDGRVVPGWKPGDRVSFVDKDTRVSEVIMGYTLKSSSTSVLEVEPILGREENGVMASLERKMQAQEKANEANRRATEAVRVAQESISRDMSRDIFANRDESVWDSFLRIDMPKLSRTIRLMAKGEWTGVVILSVQYSSGDLHRELVHIGEERFYNVKIPLGDVANALASYQVRTGTDYGQGESDN